MKWFELVIVLPAIGGAVAALTWNLTMRGISWRTARRIRKLHRARLY